MKKRTKIIIGLAALCAGTLIFGACSSDNGPYSEFAEEGYDFSVCYDANGGKTAGKNNSSVVDTYRYEQVKSGVKLYAPNDTRRGTGNFFNVERNGYFLAGWYAQRSLRVDANGVPLDEEGNPCTVEIDLLDAEGAPVYDDDGNVQKEYYSEYGKPQGYTYSDPWDFNTILQRDDFVYEEGGGYAFTLYAAWVPEFSYELQGKEEEWVCEKCSTAYHQATKPERCTAQIETGELDEDGKAITETCGSVSFRDNGIVWYSVASRQYNPVLEALDTLPVPVWNDDTGVLNYGEFSTPGDKTFVKAYASEEDFDKGANPLTAVENHGTWDEKTATATGNVTRYFAEWEEGVWYRIKTKEQLAANAGAGRSFDLLADLEYGEEDEWASVFSTGSFTGTFRGNNHTISGVSVHQTSADDTRGGLFGVISGTAVFENVTFTNITYHLEAASRKAGSMFGLFAGEIDGAAKFTNVSVGGTFYIHDSVYIPRGQIDVQTGERGPAPHVYDLGLLSGNLFLGGVSLKDLALKTDTVNASIENSATGEIKIG